MKKITRVSIISYISVLFVLLLSLDLRAQVVTMSPAAIWMKRLLQEAKKTPYNFENSSNLNISLPFGKVVSEQVKLAGQFQVADLKTELDQVKLTLNIDNAVALAKNVQIQVSIEKDLGFGSATINLNATCEAISMQLRKPQVLVANLDQALQVQGLSENFAADMIETKMIGCTAISGLDQAIQDKVMEYVRTQLLSQQFHQLLSAELSSQLGKKMAGLAQSFFADMPSLRPLHFRIDKQFRLWLFLGEDSEKFFSSDEINSISTNSQTTVLIKKEFLEMTLQQALDEQLKLANVTSKLATELQKITCSRWVQFFIWPSLRALPKCFEMELISRAKEVKFLDLKSLKFAVQVQTWVKAPEQNKDIAYFLSNSEISLASATVDIKNFSGKHFPEFLSWSGHSSRMPTSQIQGAVQALLSNKMTDLQKNKSTNVSLILSWLQPKKSKAVGSSSLSFQIKD